MIGDGGLVSAVPETDHELLGAREWELAVNHPGRESAARILGHSNSRLSSPRGALSQELAVAVCGAEGAEILAAHGLRMHGIRIWETLAHGGEPALPVRAQAAVRDDAVNIDVLLQTLRPGVQHHGDAELAAEPSGSTAELEESPRGHLEEQPANECAVDLGDGVELVGQG